MTPINELRFVERKNTQVFGVGHKWDVPTVKVLQQKWQLFNEYEWRDVPVVKEKAID